MDPYRERPVARAFYIKSLVNEPLSRLPNGAPTEGDTLFPELPSTHPPIKTKSHLPLKVPYQGVVFPQ
jgi:hypothetical protein